MRKPKLGQNFLNDGGAADRIVAALGDLSQETVLEIGPGKGAITAALARRARRLIAVELDADLAPALRERFADQISVEVLQKDILRLDLPALLAPGERVQVVGNLPYYITSDILLYLFAHHASVGRAVVMMQREVADRVAAFPGTRDYGVLSATAQLHAEVDKLFTLPPGAFSPPPDVHSTVLRLVMRPRWGELQVSPDAFLAFLKLAFAQKRKTLSNNLRNAGYTGAQIAAALAGAAIDSQIRAEALTLEQAATIFRRLGRGAISE